MRPRRNVFFTLWLLGSYVESFSGGVYRKSTVVQERMGGRTRLAAEAGEKSVEALTRAAEELRKEAEAMEAALPQRSFPETEKDQEEKQEMFAPSLDGKVVLVCGANGNIGSKVVRELLRTTPVTQVRALVSRTQNVEGYGRLSYEVGAEDGTGTIQPIWQSLDVTMEFNAERQRGYNLDRLTLLQGNVLDEAFVEAAVAGVDAVVYCVAETGPVAGISLFRKMRAGAGKSVESDGVAIVATALARQLRRRRSLGGGEQGKSSSGGNPTRFVLLSSAVTRALPLQRSIGGVQQRRGEALLATGDTGIPSFTVVRSANFDDFYTEEVGLGGIQCCLINQEGDQGSEGGSADKDEGALRAKIDSGSSNRQQRLTITPRDTARFLVSALTDSDVENKVVEIWADTSSALSTSANAAV